MVLVRTLRFLASSLLLTAVAAGAPATLGIDSRCMPEGVSIEEVARILVVELAPHGVETIESDAREMDDSRAFVVIDECGDQPPSVRATVWLHSRANERFVDLGDAAPESRSRTLALVIAETVREDPTFEAVPTQKVAASRPSRAASATPTRVDTSLPSSPVHDPSTAEPIVPRASAIVRLVPTPNTLLVGADAGIAWQRLGASVMAIGTERDTSLGTARLFVVGASISGDAVRFGEHNALRAVGEVGVGIASGSADDGATQESAAAPHLALEAGWWVSAPVATAWGLEGFLGLGYASSITARVDGRDTLATAGVFANAQLGARFP